MYIGWKSISILQITFGGHVSASETLLALGPIVAIAVVQCSYVGAPSSNSQQVLCTLRVKEATAPHWAWLSCPQFELQLLGLLRWFKGVNGPINWRK
jgi:hypothetical protein